jgi:transcriptional regulator with XRE-family HTH domain
MSPKELRAFRESLGLSRRAFAPKLMISDPTLERWERGQGGPREAHLQILKRMREHLGAGHPIAYFQYDAGEEARAAEVENEDKQMIVETLRGLGALVLVEEQSQDRRDWSVSFGLGWSVGERIDVALHCEGSDRPERPAIDFILEITASHADVRVLSTPLQRVCRNHSIFGSVARRDGGGAVIVMRDRLFTTGCNPETVKHVVGNYRSCWQRLKAILDGSKSSHTPGRESQAALSTAAEGTA